MFSGKYHAQWVKDFFKEETKNQTACKGRSGFCASVEHKGHAEAQSTDRRDGKKRDGARDLLEAILDRDNLNRAYKAKLRTQCPQSDAGSKGIYPRLDWLFSSSRYEADAAVL